MFSNTRITEEKYTVAKNKFASKESNIKFDIKSLNQAENSI